MMFRLAENERTARRARIKRGSALGRAALRREEREVRRRLQTLYEQARAEIEQTIIERGDQLGILRLGVLQDLRAQLDASIDRLGRRRDQLLDEALARAIAIGVGPFSADLPAASLGRISDQILLFMHSYIEADGLQLSDRLWRLDQHARESVGRAVETAVIQGHSASRAAQEFLARGVAVPADVAAKMEMAGAGRLARVAGRALMTGDGERSAYANALRVFRTEINRAHGEAYRASLDQLPDVIGVRFVLSPAHPQRDVCDMHASVNRYGLGPGVYPKGKSPWPAHPNTLSFEEVVFADEVTDEDRRGQEDRISWLQRQPPEIQEAVLGSRMKRGALEQGKLTEGQISTPWRVLKVRYQQQGIDIASLTPVPVRAQFAASRGKAMDREGAVAFVLERGRAAGVEYACAFDTRTGVEAFRKTSNQRSAVYFDEAEVALFRDPRNRIELVHNHPSSSSLSVADLNLSRLPGIERVVAVGHDGGIYAGKALVEGTELQRLAKEVDQRLYDVILPLYRRGELSERSANMLHPHLKNATLAKLGAVDYQVVQLGPSLAEGLREVGGQWVEQVLQDLVKQLRGGV